MPEFKLHNHKELFRRVADGDEQAFTEIYYHYTRAIYPFVLKKLRSESVAEETVQEIFMVVWANREKFATIENPEGYLYRIASNAVINHYRRLAHEDKMQKEIASGNITGESSSEQKVDYRELSRIADLATRKLPTQRKLIFELRQEGLSYEEIAARLELTPNTVRNQLVAANKFIRDYLKNRGIHPLSIILFFILDHPDKIFFAVQ